MFHESSGILCQIAEEFASRPNVTLLEEEEKLIGMVAADDDSMDRVVRDLKRFQACYPNLSYQRNTVYLRLCHKDYDKGAALAELARTLDVRPEHILAAGDHYNDLPMLNPEIAKWLACPANAIDPVKQRVRAAAGFVAEEPAGKGISDVLRLF